MRRPLAAVALCLVVALAGCSLPSDSSGAELTTENGTIGDSSSLELTTENAPPGVSADAGTLADADALLAAHNESLVVSGFVTEVRANATVVRNGQRQQVRRTQIVRAESGLDAYNTTVRNPSSRFDIWGNDSIQAVRLQTRDDIQYGTSKPRPAATLTGTGLLSRYLTTGNWSVTNATTRGGEPVFTLRSTAVPTEANAVPENATNLREYGAVAVVDSAGRVRYFEATGTYTLDGESASFTVSHRVVSEGQTVDRPSWVAEVL